MKLTRAQAAKKHGLTERWIRRKQEQGVLRTFEVPGSREVFVDEDELSSLFRVREVAPRRPGIRRGDSLDDELRAAGFAPAAGGISRRA